jgi:hypothetical protein
MSLLTGHLWFLLTAPWLWHLKCICLELQALLSDSKFQTQKIWKANLNSPIVRHITVLLPYKLNKAFLRLRLPISDSEFCTESDGVFSFSMRHFLPILQLYLVWKASVVPNFDWIKLRTCNWTASRFANSTLIHLPWAIRTVLLPYHLKKAISRLRFPISDSKFHADYDGVFSFSIRCFLLILQLDFVWKACNVLNPDWINLRTLQLDVSRFQSAIQLLINF